MQTIKITAGKTATAPFTLIASSTVTSSTVQSYLNSNMHVRAATS